MSNFTIIFKKFQKRPHLIPEPVATKNKIETKKIAKKDRPL